MDRKESQNQILSQDSRNNDYIARMGQLTQEYNKAMLKNFEYYLHMAGTNVTVRRVGDSEFREALGAAYIFDGTENDSEKVEVYQKRIVINRSLLMRNYRSTIEDIDALTNENFYKIGDQIEFNFLNINFKYKITDIDQFDPYSEMLYKLTLSGFEEYKKD